MQRVETVKWSGPWSSLGILVHAEDGDHETVRPMMQSMYSWLSGGYVVVMYFLQWWHRKFWLFKLNLTLKVKVNRPPKTIAILTKVFYTFGPNLVILVWKGRELSCGQASDWYTDTRTHRRRQRQYPKAKTGLGWKWSIDKIAPFQQMYPKQKLMYLVL